MKTNPFITVLLSVAASVIAVLLVVKPQSTENTTEVHYYHDSDRVVKVPVPYLVELPGKSDTFWKDADTQAILSDYFSKISYLDTFFKDSLYFATLHQEVTQNRIAKQDFKIDILQKHTTTIMRTDGTYVGALAGYTNKPFFMLSGSHISGKNVYEVGVGNGLIIGYKRKLK